MKLIRQILESPELQNDPPVLIDIGASGEIHAKWKAIAPWSVCIAFDADDRDFRVNETAGSGFKKLLSVNRIVTSGKGTRPDFYLTSSPYCSSLLKPDQEKLKPWVLSDLFIVDKVSSLPAITIDQALEEAGLHYIDWFKTDTQGTDLRLYTSLSPGIQAGILAAEFEPGIIDAYEGEDKLFMIMEVMHQKGFWLSTMDVKGFQRLQKKYADQLGFSSIRRSIRNSPCWAEVTYLRQSFDGSKRQYLLTLVFAILEKQYGFAIEVCDMAMESFPDEIFIKSKKAVLRKINTEKMKNPLVIFKRQFNKLLSGIND